MRKTAQPQPHTHSQLGSIPEYHSMAGAGAITVTPRGLAETERLTSPTPLPYANGNGVSGFSTLGASSSLSGSGYPEYNDEAVAYYAAGNAAPGYTVVTIPGVVQGPKDVVVGRLAVGAEDGTTRGGRPFLGGATRSPHDAAEDHTILGAVWQRLSVLVTLLLLQSGSQFILERYEGLITANVIIPLFLTMLVGAGGNAGNQAAVHSITGLVTGEYRLQSWSRVVRREVCIGFACSCVLFVIAYMRVHYFYTTEETITTGMFETVFSISFSLFCIVLSSVVLGSLLPFLLLFCGLNVEHAAPIIQVVMDIFGVFITCAICSQFLPSSTAQPVPMASTPSASIATVPSTGL
jgi:cation transporter-like permease